MIAARQAQQAYMQQWMEGFMDSNPPSNEDIDRALKDFGFYHRPREVVHMYSEKINRGLLGYAGGVIDQPDEYWADMATMRWLELWIEHVKPMARLEQTSVFHTLRNEGRLQGKMANGDN